MTLEEARAIVAAEDDRDPTRALEALALVLRFYAISDPRLLGAAEAVEQAIEGDRQ